MSRFYITTAIPYANGAPHIGHAYERIATDAIQRFMRLDGRETLFVTGVDEYGLKVQQAAAREGVTPQAFVDRVHPKDVVFSVGPRNRFGFPRPSVVSRYAEVGARLTRTDLDGAVTFITDGKTGYRLETTVPLGDGWNP